VRIAVCDVDGDGVDEIVTVPGPGYPPQVTIWELGARRSTRLVTFNAGPNSYTKGFFVACGDLDGDGASEIVIGNDRGSTPEIKVYRVRGTQVTLLASDLAYEPSFTGGVRVTTADIDGDGLAEIITAPGAGGESWVRVLKISGNGLAELTSFEGEEPGFAAGLFIAGGKRDDLGGAVVATSPGPGGPGHIRIFSVSPAAVVESVKATTGPSGVTLGASP
jgi:fibronectin-binding autotransporter adhesin